MPAGRPTIYSDSLADELCRRIAMGESVRAITRDPDFPCMSTFFAWLREKPEFLQLYEIAKDQSADSMVDEMLDIADNAENDWMERNHPSHEGYQLNGENIQRSRLRIDARKWIASKLKPKKYSEKMGVDIAGVQPIINLTANMPENKTD